MLNNKNSYNTTFVAWDFVELPSQLMEHWVTEPEMLSIYARHYETGEQMPASLVDKIRNSSYFNQGFSNVEIYAASLLDMAYHTLEAPVNIDIQTFEKDYFTKLGLIPEIVSRYRSTYFTHITGDMIPATIAIHGLQFLIMMLLRHLKRKVYLTGQQLNHILRIFWKRMA